MSFPSPYQLAVRWHEIQRTLKVRAIRATPLDASARQQLEIEAADIAAVLAGLPGEPERMTNFFVEVRGTHTDGSRRCFEELRSKELQPHEAESYLLHHDLETKEVAVWLRAKGHDFLEGKIEQRGWSIRIFVELGEIDGLLCDFWADWSMRKDDSFRPFVAVFPAPREVQKPELYPDAWP